MEYDKTTKQEHILTFLYKHSQGLRHWYFGAFFCALLSIISGFLVPQVVRFAVDSLLSQEDSALPDFLQQALQIQSTTQVLYTAAIAVVVFALISAIGNFSSRLCVATGTERFSKSLRNKLFAHVQHLPFSWHVASNTGDIIQRCTADLDAVRGFVANQFLEVIRTVLLVSVALGILFSMNVTLTLLVLFFLPVILSYSLFFYRRVGQRFLAADEAEGVLTGVVQENLTGVRVVRAFGRECFELDRFDKFNRRFADLWIELGKVMAPYWAVGDLVTGMQILTIVVAGALMAANGQITLGEFLVFVSYSQTLSWPIRALGRTLSEMSKTQVSAQRLEEILNATPEAEECSAVSVPLNEEIRFENVSFAYNEKPVLHNVTFSVPKGSTLGILGPTGSGKSTLTYLLCRLYELQDGNGHITVGGVSIGDIRREHLRKNVSLVLQEPFLFSKTIAQNIAIMQDTPDMERVVHYAKAAALDESVSGFAKGYNTMVGERGVTLSGGQKQRVVIARGLMQNAPVMIFDDSLSAVDLETDVKIRKRLKEEKGDSTLILISHRINTLMQADNILVLEDGAITAMGTHRELIQTPGLYKRIYDAQNICCPGAVFGS